MSTARSFDLWHDVEPLNHVVNRAEERIAEAVDHWEGNDRIHAAVIAKGIADDLRRECPRIPRRLAYALVRFMVENTADARQEAREEAARAATAAEEEPVPLTGRELLGSLRAADEYRIVTGDATADEIARARSMSASQVVHLFSIPMDEGRTVTGTRDRITALTREDGSEGLTALRLNAAGEVIV